MANDPVLIERVRDLAPMDMTERTVFGARCWLLAGNVAFGVHGDDLLVRLGDDGHGLPGFAPFGDERTMKGWYVAPGDDLAEDADISAWIERATAFAADLPPK